MRTNRVAYASLLALSLSPVAACDGWNAVETGDYGWLDFVPDDCGRGSCDLDDPIAVGGSLAVRVEPVDGGYLGPIDLVPDDPAVVTTLLVDESAYSSSWQIAGLEAGWVGLSAIDEWGYVIDRIDVRVRHPDALHLELVEGEAFGPTEQPGFGEVWRVRAGQPVAFHARPSSAGHELMGRLVYDVAIDRPLFDALEDPSALDLGQLHARAPAGAHAVRFVAPDGLTLDALVIAE